MRILAVLLFCLWPGIVSGFPVERCVNLSNFLEAPRGAIWGPRITEAHIDAIAAAGFDTVRLPVRFSDRWTGRIDPWRLARADAMVAEALKRGLNVIVVVHHYDDLMRDPATHGPRLRAIWAELAEHWQGYPEGLIFEVLNEPAPPLDTRQAVALYREIIPIIRARHPQRWIIVEGGNWASWRSLGGLPRFDRRTVRSFHYYDPAEVTHQLAPWHVPRLPAAGWNAMQGRAAIARDFAQARAQAVGPLFLGEFGVYRRAPLALRAEWTRAVRQAAEARGIAWCVWGFGAEFRIFDTSANRWIAPMLEALMRD